MWQELLNYLNGDNTLSGIIANFLGNTLSTTVSDGLKRLFKKKQEKKDLDIDDCKQLIKEEDLAAILEEIRQLILKVGDKKDAPFNVYNAPVNYKRIVNNFYGDGITINQ
jgi:hypothetical protein